MNDNRSTMRSSNHIASCAQNDMRRSMGGCRESYPFGRTVRTPHGVERLGGWKNTCGQSRQTNEMTRENGCGMTRGNGCGQSRGNGGSSCPWSARADQSRTANETTRENGRGCGCGCNAENSDCERLLAQIRAVDFALVEVVLYLDVYPDSCEALETYHKLIARRCALNEEYETACGPLTAMGNKSHTSWDWIDKPAPWEYNAN